MLYELITIDLHLLHPTLRQGKAKRKTSGSDAMLEEYLLRKEAREEQHQKEKKESRDSVPLESGSNYQEIASREAILVEVQDSGACL